MKKLITFLSLSAILLTSCVVTAKNMQFSGQTETQKLFQNETITSLAISSLFEVEVSQGSQNSVEITSSVELKDHLVAELSNGKLTLKLKQGINNDGNYGKNLVLKAKIVCSKLDAVSLSGMAKCRFITPMTADNIKIDLSGMSTLNASHSLDAQGNATVDVSGMSNLNLDNLKAQNLSVDASGMSNGTIICDVAGTIDADVSGMTKITLKGESKITSLNCSGMSSLNASGLSSGSFSVKTSGMSSVSTGPKK